MQQYQKIKTNLNIPFDMLFHGNKKIQTILIAFIIMVFLIKLFDLLFHPEKTISERLVSFSLLDLLVVCILGAFGLYFYNKIKFSDFWNKDIKKAKTILLSLGLGILF